MHIVNSLVLVLCFRVRVGIGLKFQIIGGFFVEEERKFAMAKGSQSQASTTASSARGTATGGALPRSSSSGAPPKGTGGSGLRRRRTTSTGSGGGSGSYRSGNSNMLRFYTDDAPGLKITPTVVLVMSLCFIGFVTCLHVIGKLYNYRSKA